MSSLWSLKIVVKDYKYCLTEDIRRRSYNFLQFVYEDYTKELQYDYVRELNVL